MKVIFLDFDGVMNTESFVLHFFKIMEMSQVQRPEAKQLRKVLIQDTYGNLFDPLCLNLLEWIIEETEAKIVVSSAWRNSGLEWIRNMWKDRGYPGEIYDITPYIWNAKRGEEIDKWLGQHTEVSKYVIFDDDSDMLTHQRPFFFQCDERYGITYEIAKKAVKVLNDAE